MSTDNGAAAKRVGGRPGIQILCGRKPITRFASVIISELGCRESPVGDLKLVFDAPPSYALRVLQGMDGGTSQAVVVTWNRCAEHLLDLWELGCAALVAGEQYDGEPADTLRTAIETVQRGERCRLIPWVDVRLTKRERPMLRLVASGYSNRVIGEELGLTERSVSNAFTQIYSKLGVSNRAEAALYYWGIEFGCGLEASG